MKQKTKYRNRLKLHKRSQSPPLYIRLCEFKRTERRNPTLKKWCDFPSAMLWVLTYPFLWMILCLVACLAKTFKSPAFFFLNGLKRFLETFPETKLKGFVSMSAMSAIGFVCGLEGQDNCSSSTRSATLPSSGSTCCCCCTWIAWSPSPYFTGTWNRIITSPLKVRVIKWHFNYNQFHEPENGRDKYVWQTVNSFRAWETFLSFS